MNPQEFIKRWIEGMKNLSPLQILHAKVIGNLGGTIGLILGFVFMVFIQKLWWWGVFLFFMIWLQITQYISAKQQYDATVKIMEDIEKNSKEDDKDGFRV